MGRDSAWEPCKIVRRIVKTHRVLVHAEFVAPSGPFSISVEIRGDAIILEDGIIALFWRE